MLAERFCCCLCTRRDNLNLSEGKLYCLDCLPTDGLPEYVQTEIIRRRSVLTRQRCCLALSVIKRKMHG
jgi:hypothetical protein